MQRSIIMAKLEQGLKAAAGGKFLKQYLAAGAVAALAAFLVYLPALGDSFVNWDDQMYVYNNRRIHSLSFDFFRWALTSDYFGNYHPLTVIAYAIEYRLWGLKPYGYILTNVVLHSLNTFLVFMLAVRVLTLSRRPYGQAAAANAPGAGVLAAGLVASLLFGVHPLHVESVAWISETKDVMCALFYMLGVLAYLEYAAGNPAFKKAYYSLSLVFALLAIMSKPMAVSLPFALLILDVYPCRRALDGGFKLNDIKRALFEKAPFFMLSVLSGVLTLRAQSRAGFVSALVPPGVRAAVAARGYVFYIYKMVMPFNLVPVYPYPKNAAGLLSNEYILSYAAFCVLAAACVFMFKRNRGFTAALACYAVVLLPVSGIVQTGSQSAADRYAYLPSVSLFILAGACAGRLVESRRRLPKAAAVIIAVFVFPSLSILTVWQEGIWKDSITLWSHEIKHYPGVYGAYVGRGDAYSQLGDKEDALRDINAAIKINPEGSEAYNNRARVYIDSGEPAKAFDDLDRAVMLNPKDAGIHNNRGVAYGRLSKHALAVKEYTSAIAIDPGDVQAYFNRANSYLLLGDAGRAIGDYTAAVRLDPEFANAYFGRAGAYVKTGELEKAAADARVVVKLDPSNPAAYYAIGEIYMKLGNRREAQENIDRADAVRKQGKGGLKPRQSP